jgi:hypothetical protein
MRKALLAILLVFLCSSYTHAQTTVTGHVISAGGVATNQVFIRFRLQNLGGNVPRLNGTGTGVCAAGAIVPSVVDSFPVAGGVVSQTICGNDVIAPTNTYYTAEYWYNGQPVTQFGFIITGASFNLDAQPPLSGSPPPPVNSGTPGHLVEYVTATTAGDAGIAANNVPLLNGANAFTGTESHAALESFAGGISVDGTHIETIPSTTSTLVDYKTNTRTLKKGPSGGNYSHSGDTSVVDVDTVNLQYIVTIPTGWNLGIACSGEILSATGIATVRVYLYDSVPATQIVGTESYGGGIALPTPFALNWVIAGDGASHTIKLQFETSNGADAVQIVNTTPFVPTMVFTLMPSN